MTGIARGVAYRLIEELGVLERQKVAEDVKGLDQAARASLRKYGVRFGAYHIYIPPLLKPAPRALGDAAVCAQARVRRDARARRGAAARIERAHVDRGQQGHAKNLYRVAGYRVAGERAVRVDILERLADLIRPALAWRDNAPGIKPQGALDGTGFTVTVGMTSLVGSSGEDFASILRSLGYRMERRPKPPEPVAAQPRTVPTAGGGCAEPADAKSTLPDATPRRPSAVVAARLTMRLLRVATERGVQSMPPVGGKRACRRRPLPNRACACRGSSRRESQCEREPLPRVSDARPLRPPNRN